MYYPKSQIKLNLYTNGEEYALSTTGELYIGYFYEISNGNKFTGSPSSDTPNILLIPINPNISGNPQLTNQKLPPNPITKVNSGFPPLPNSNPIQTISDYISNNDSGLGRSLPIPIQTLPTQKDKDLGSFPRYFCKKTNENLYIEINKEQFTKLQSRDITIAWDLYTPLQIIWQIKGDKTQTYNANKNNITLIEQRNKWYGFTKYFKDNFLKYYLES